MTGQGKGVQIDPGDKAGALVGGEPVQILDVVPVLHMMPIQHHRRKRGCTHPEASPRRLTMVEDGLVPQEEVTGLNSK